MVQSLMWNSDTNMLAAFADGKLSVWFYPNVIYVDRDLLQKTVSHRDARFAQQMLQYDNLLGSNLFI